MTVLTARDRATVAGLVAILAAVAILVAMPGTTPPPVPGSSATPSPTGWQTPTVTRYREGVIGTWSSITPLTARTLADRQLVALLFSGLLRLGPGQTLEPDLAADWRTEEDGKRYLVTLRSDATWHDGTPVTADDVLFTFELLRDPASGARLGTSWDEVSVSRIDETTVAFDLATALAGFPQALTEPILPRHLLGDLEPAAIATSDFARAPIGSGPFRLAALDAQRAELVRVADPAPEPTPTPSPTPRPSATTGTSNDTSTSTPAASASPVSTAAASPTASPTGSPAIPSTPRPITPGARPIDIFEMRFIPDEAGLLAAFAAGEVDAIAGLGPEAVPRAAATDGTTILRYGTATVTAVIPNQRGMSAYRNELVRTALSVAIDRDAVLASILGAEGVRADGLIPPGSWAYDRSVVPAIEFDREAATKALTKAGWKRGGGSWIAKGHTKPLVISLIAPNASTNPYTFAAGELVAAAWRSIGFAVEFEGVERDVLATRLQSGAFQLAVVSMNIGLDPDLYPFLASTQVRTDGANVAGVQDRTLDNLLAAARRPGSPFDRRTAYKRVQAYLSAKGFLFPLYVSSLSIPVADRVEGVTLRQVDDPGDRYWDVLTWRLAAGR